MSAMGRKRTLASSMGSEKWTVPCGYAPRNDDIPYLVIASEARQSSYFFFGLCDDDCFSWIGACSYQK